MAIDVYLQIEGIKGESADSAHQGWIELSSVNMGVLQPRSATASTGGGHTAALRTPYSIDQQAGRFIVTHPHATLLHGENNPEGQTGIHASGWGR